MRKRELFLIQLFVGSKGVTTQFKGTVKFIKTGWSKSFCREDEVTAIMKEFLVRFSDGDEDEEY